MEDDSKVLLYCSYGYTSHDFRFVEAASKDGWRVFALRFDGGSSSLDERGLPEGCHRISWIGDVVAITNSNSILFSRQLSKLLVALRPNLIQAGPLHNVASAVVEVAGSIPVLSMSWGFDLLSEYVKSSESKTLVTSALSRSSGILVDCETLREAAVRSGARSERILVVPWGVDLDVFSYRPLTNSRTPTILSLRSLETLYDVQTLLRAIFLLSQDIPGHSFKVLIAGDGQQKNRLVDLARSLNVQQVIKWTGRIPESEVPIILEEADIYVSTSPIDGSSISLLQAMASGRICVVTNISSNREWVDDGVSGRLFSPGDPNSLASVLSHLLEFPSSYAYLGLEARRKVEMCADWTIGARSYVAFLNKVASF